MHIGFLSFESPLANDGGGIASYLRAMIPALIEAGHRVTLIAPHTGDAVNPCPRDLRVVPVRLPQVHWYASKLPLARSFVTLPLREAEWSLAFCRAAAKAMREDPMDVLETSELGSWWVACHPPAPVVLRLHGAEYTFARYSGQAITVGSSWTRRLQRQALRHAAVVTSPSRSQAAEVAGEMHWDAGRIAVVPNAIAPAMLAHSADFDPAIDASSAAPMILYTGRLARVKGTPLLLAAAARVLERFPSAEFVLAGAWQMPEPPSEWPRWLERAGVAGRITWLGSQCQDQLAALYRRSTIFVMPSNYESFGISCLEAMAFQVPVVATRAGALPEIVENGWVGLTTAPGDAEALSSAICTLLGDSDLRRRMGAAGRARVLAEFTPEAVRDHMVAVYQRARQSMPRTLRLKVAVP
jgi:glycosyltransferase involved in cell wall biosynthesis